MKNTFRYITLSLTMALSGLGMMAQTSTNSGKSVFGANGIGWNPGPRVTLMGRSGNTHIGNGQPAGNQVGAPGSNGIGWNPAPGAPLSPNQGPAGNPGPNPNGGPAFNNNWNGGFNAGFDSGFNNGFNNGFGPGWNANPPAPVIENVLAVGYDDSGNLIQEPLQVSVVFNGVNYNVTVVNAWNPWTDTWTTDVDMPAYATSYLLGGNIYDYYTPLASGTYYFNL